MPFLCLIALIIMCNLDQYFANKRVDKYMDEINRRGY